LEIPGYRIEEQIAEGGMATVYVAIQESLDRRVALKLLKKFDTPGQAERFVNEGRIIASLNHRNIITIHDIGRVEGRHYISMEYLEGGDLEQRIREGIPPDAAIALTRTLGQCLAFIHDKGIIHRDIKPGNILFRKDGTPILTDFGIAKEMHRDTSLTMDGSALGSPDYLSPEQAESKSLDGRADLYSLGIVLFEMLTGEKPYRGDSYIETVMEHITAPIPDLPRALKPYQELVDRMIAKRPGDRFASAGDMIAFIDTLDRAPADEGLSRKFAGLVGSLHRSGAPSSGPAPTMEVAQEELPLAPAHAGTHVAPETAAIGMPRSPLRYLLLAGAVLVLAASATMLALAPFEETVIEAPDPAPSELERHLASAREAMQSERLTSPPENNAYFHYRKALESDPQNETAMQGIADIAGRYADSAEQQITQGNLDAARLQIENGLGVLPGEARLEALSQRVTELENAEIEAYLLRAKVALDANKLTTPAEDNAYAHYQEVLARRPDHEEALNGIALIADRYADLAQGSIDGYEYSDAKVYVQKGLKVQPEHARLLALQERTNAVKDVPDRILKGIKSAFD
jgi:serine/threonine-protein kinase PpkA